MFCFLMIRLPPRSTRTDTLFPYTTLFRSSKTLSRELAPDGITVNNVLPGYTRTQRLEQILDDRSASTGKSRDAIAATMLSRSEEHTSELQSLMRISYAVFCLKKKQPTNTMYYR